MTTWTLPQLVAEAARRLAALPAPKNGQVRAVPDERTIRYYAALGLLDRPAAMKGRVGLYGTRHLAQVVAIKRLQSSGKRLAEIEALWPTLDDGSLARMTGVAVEKRSGARADFWKQGPRSTVDGRRSTVDGRRSSDSDSDSGSDSDSDRDPRPQTADRRPQTDPHLRMQARLELAPGVALVFTPTTHLTPSDLRAIRAAAEPLIAELASRSSMEEP